MATKYTKNADGTVTSTFNVDAPNPTTQAPIQPQQGTTYSQNADGTVTSTFNQPVQPAQPVEKPQQTGTTYKQNADGTVTSTFNQPTQTVQNQNQITDWKNLTDDQKTLDNLSKLVNNRYNTQSTINGQNVNATIGDGTYSWYLDEGKNPIKTQTGTVQKQGEVQPNMAPTGLVFDRTSDWSALRPQDKTINNLQKLIEARYGTLAEVEGDRVVADIGGKMYQWTLDPNGNPVKTEVPADNTQFNSGEILEQLKANPSLDLSTYDPTQAAIAKNNFTKIQNFDGMNSDQLNESLQSGALLVGTEVRNNMNPQQRQIVDMVSTLNMIKGIFLDPLLINENAEKNILANAGPLAQALEDNYLSTAEVDEITITPEMKQMKNNADFWGDEMNRLRTNYEYLEDDIEEELKGQNATASYRDRYMAKEGKALYRALTTAQRNYQMYYGQYNDERERAMQLLNTNIQLYQKAQDRAYEEEQQLKEFQRQIALQNYGMVTDYMNTLENRAYNEDLMQRQREWEKEDAIWNLRTKQEWTTGNLDSEDPTLRDIGVRNTVNSWYEQYPFMVGMEAQEAKIEKVYKRAEGKVAQGMSWGDALREALSEEEQVIRNSDRFKQEMATNNLANQYERWKMNEAMTPTTSGYSGYSGYTTGGLTSNGGNTYISNSGKTYTYNANSGTYSDGSGTSIPSGAIVADGFSRDNPNGDYTPGIKATYKNNEIVGIQCGDFAKQRAGVGITLGDINNRRKLFTDSTPVAGGMVFFDKGYNSKYGHVAYVKAVDEANGKILIEETNLKGNNEYGQRWVDMNNSSIYGYYNNTPAVKNNYAMNESSMTVQSGNIGKPQLTITQENLVKQALSGTNPKNDDITSYFGNDANFNQAVQDYKNWQNSTYEIYGMKGLAAARSVIAPMIYGKNVSEGEGNNVVQMMEDNPEYGVLEIARKLKQLDVKDEKNKQIAEEYLTYLSNLSETPNTYKGLSDALNKGDYGRAFGWVMNNVDKELGDINATTDFLIGQDNINELLYLIDKNQDKIGLINGNISKIKQKFEGDNEMQRILTLLSIAQADIRRFFGGTAVTETEMKALENYIGGDIIKNAENLATQLRKTQANTQNNYYTARRDLVGLGMDDMTAYLNYLATGNFTPTDKYSKVYGYFDEATYNPSSSSSSSSGDTKSSVTLPTGETIYYKKNTF